MRAVLSRWLRGDDRTLALYLGTGILLMALLRLDRVRQVVGVPDRPHDTLVLVLLATVLAWSSMLSRGFVWLEPAVLTWNDFGATDRERLLARRLLVQWAARMLALGYLLALLTAVAGLGTRWVLAGVAAQVAAGALVLGAVGRPRRPGWVEPLVVLGFAAAAVAVRPGPDALTGVAVALGLAAAVLLTLLARSGPLTRPEIVRAGRGDLVQGWRERVMRVVGTHFLDVAMLLPAGRPVRGWRLTAPVGVRLAWVGVAARTRRIPTALLLALVAVAAHLALPALPDEVVFALFGYLALVPLTGGLAELWRSPGRRRWVGHSDLRLRAAHLAVLTVLAAVWAGLALGLAAAAGAPWETGVVLAVPLVSACAVRTATGAPPAYDNLMPVATPFGTLPVRLVTRTLRGPDLGLFAVLLVPTVPLPVGAAVVTAAVAVAVLR
ncbi:hypothetical protein [Actinophytocola xanthii]|uniref:Uncharacterized protein n=1 Tax=Actinophytocola xanthii TaxID=1912961 RepID=A0A1Q8CT47_9PSEU|nr:hypothetical protein [Actinophytocola xanthii]OLF17530.1 hypothetical protein BU204_11430 [Actinophytocola xanthii]